MAKKSFQDLQKSMVAFDRGSSPRVREMTRDAFFDGRQDVSADRLARRAFQEQRTTDFKNKFTKQVPNTGGTLLQMTSDAPRSLSAERERLANLYGPTLGEIGSDIRFGLGRIAQDLKDKGAPIFQLIKSLGEKIFPSRPVVNYGGETTMEVIDESVPFVAPTFDDPKININRLDSVFPPSEMDDETFQKEVLDFLYPQVKYEPIRVSDMDMSGIMANNAGQNIIGELQNLQNLANQYNLNRFQLMNPFFIAPTPKDNEFQRPIPGVNIPDNRVFNVANGGPVDKYSGLGYKLK